MICIVTKPTNHPMLPAYEVSIIGGKKVVVK